MTNQVCGCRDALRGYANVRPCGARGAYVLWSIQITGALKSKMWEENYFKFGFKERNKKCNILISKKSGKQGDTFNGGEQRFLFSLCFNNFSLFSSKLCIPTPSTTLQFLNSRCGIHCLLFCTFTDSSFLFYGLLNLKNVSKNQSIKK